MPKTLIAATTVVMGILASAEQTFAQASFHTQELRLDGEVARLRLVTNGAGPLRHEDVADVFAARCAQLVPELDEGSITQIVVSIADREVPFGETDTEAVQFFELYDFIDGQCIWRGF